MASAELVRRMADSIAHRGPDGHGYHCEPGVALGHRRLSIIDLATGQQPLSNEDGSVWITFNGEIYNYLELHAWLVHRGHTFRTKSDTEVIVHLYEEIGESCFAKLRGMFALAIWDRNKRQLVLARDRLGKKPLYYHHGASRIVFGSEMKAVMAAGDIPRNVDITAVADYFAFQYIPSPKTIYSAVRKLRPAHYAVLDTNGFREQPYWDLSFQSAPVADEDSLCAEVRDWVADATRVRLMSEVPLGSFLSGGVDSSAVVGSMAPLSNRPVTTCAVGFDVEPYSELQYARKMAELVGADHHESVVTPSALAIVEKLAWHYDEPFADSSAVPTYYVSRAAREHVTVALSGDGGDESFAGYHRYHHQAHEDRLRALLPRAIRKNVVGPLGTLYPSMPAAPRFLRAKATLLAMARDPLEGYLAFVSLPAYWRDRLLTPECRQQLKDYDPLELFRDHIRRADGPDVLSKIQYLDIKTYLTDDICVKVDRASMAVSLEVRCPLLDHQLMERAARVPSQFKLRNNTGKYILKKAFEPIVPADLLYRRKHGFGVPVGEWFRGELKGWASRVLFETPQEFLVTSVVREIWDAHQSGAYDYSALLWTISMFNYWYAALHRESGATQTASAVPTR